MFWLDDRVEEVPDVRCTSSLTVIDNFLQLNGPKNDAFSLGIFFFHLEQRKLVISR